MLPLTRVLLYSQLSGILHRQRWSFNSGTWIMLIWEWGHAGTCGCRACCLRRHVQCRTWQLVFFFLIVLSVLIVVILSARSASKQKMQRVSNISIAVMYCMYFLAALFGYLTFYGTLCSVSPEGGWGHVIPGDVSGITGLPIVILIAPFSHYLHLFLSGRLVSSRRCPWIVSSPSLIISPDAEAAIPINICFTQCNQMVDYYR